MHLAMILLSLIHICCGADAIVAEGTETGGHIGENTTMVLVPQIVDSVQIPVIAAGGIADGRGMAAAFMLGAEGIQMGTRFVATVEAEDVYKRQDYIEPGRKELPNMKDVRQMAFEDIDKCLYKILEDSLVYLNSRGIPIDPMTEQTYLYYKEEQKKEE